MNPTATGPNVQSTLDSINQQIGSINQSAGSSLPTVNIPTTISSKQLTPQPSITVTQPNPSSAAAGLNGAIQSTTDQYQANLDKQEAAAAAAGAPGGTSLQQLMDALNSKQGASALTDQAYTQSVDPAQAALSKINQQIVAERNANQQQLDALRANPGGAFGTGLQQQLDQVNQLSLSRQANLAVIQMAAQGQYDSAKTIADRAVAAATEAQQNHINALQLSYEANKDQFTKAEQRSFEAAQKTRQDALDEKTYETRAKYDQLIKQHDPLYQAQLAKARADAATAAGANIVVGDTTPVQVVNTGAGTTPVSVHSLAAGEDPYTIAQQNGTDMATLRKLNPGIKDWTQLPVGAQINLPNANAQWLAGKTQQQVDTYNNLPTADKASIKQLVNGDALLTDIVKSRGANTQAQINKLISEATAIDPNFSINGNKQRFAYKQQFNNPNGKEQSQINSINTALGHLAEFNTASSKLGNTLALPYNKLINYLKENAGNPDVSNLNNVITALSGELASVYKNGTAPTDQETEQWRNTILASFSKAQSAGVSATTANLISNKMLALNNSYKNVMGAYPDSPIINSDVIQQLHAAGVDVSTITDRLQKQGYNVPTTATHDPLGFTSNGSFADLTTANPMGI